MLDTNIDTLHNIFCIFYYCTVIYLSYSIILDNLTNMEFIIKQYDLIYFYSTIFFPISGIIYIFDKSYIYIIHHLISWIIIYYGYIYKNPNNILWICQNLLVEISSIFLAIDIIVKNINKNYNNMLIKILFFITYTIIIIIYLLPININYLLANSFEDNY